MKYTYTIEENTSLLKIFEEGRDTPLLIQDKWPSGNTWANRDEAEDWAKLYISSHLGSDDSKRPGPSPLQPVLVEGIDYNVPEPEQPAEETPAE